VNLTPPPEKYVKPKALKKVMKSAEKVAKGLGIEGYCRVDIFVNVDNGDVIVIEINTTPALTPSTVLYHQALCEKRPIFPREFIETLVRNKGY
jgi:D-alanine-D-alanine ligase-like ATP-grasp enzyme